MKHMLFGILITGVIGAAACAVPVDPNAGDGIAALLYHDNSMDILTTNGEYSSVGIVAGSILCELAEIGIPVPLHEIKDRQWNTVITNDLVVWHWEGSPDAS